MAMLAALVSLAAGHGEGRRATSKWEAHLAGEAASGHIWGSCGDDLADEGGATSCRLVGGASCSDHLSEGPPDADLEIVLGNLPPSTSDGPVHLQWWAAFKSEHEYQPLASAHGAAVYSNMHTAYPQYWEPGFNGGNVRVNESGVAVVRFAAPATYYFTPYLAWPHVHFRVCEGDANADFYYDSLGFSTTVWMQTRSQDSPITILSQNYYASDNGVQNYSIPESIGYLNVPSTSTATTSTTSSRTTTTSSTTSITATTSIAVVSSTVDFTGTTFSEAATSTINILDTGSLHAILISAEMEALTLDALEFSPVYDCLVEGAVFDHFSGSCADSCPDDAELQYGQCVLPETGSQVTLTASWHMEVHCKELCGVGMENETLHNVRLGVAGHLDVPFQEVARTALTWLDAEGRRLSTGVRSAVLSVQVETRRHDKINGLDSLWAFVASPNDVGRVLGMTVEKVEVLSEGATISDGPTWTITDDSDPYTVAYNVFLGEQADGDKQASAAGSRLATEAVVGLIVSMVACGFACGGLLWVLRRRSRLSLTGSNAKDVLEVAGTAVSKDNNICVEFDEQDDNARQDDGARRDEQDDAALRDEQDDDIEI